MDPNVPPNRDFMTGVPFFGRGRAQQPQEPALGRSMVLPAADASRVVLARGFLPSYNTPSGHRLTPPVAPAVIGRARGLLSQHDVGVLAGRARGLLPSASDPKAGLARGTVLTTLEPPCGPTLGPGSKAEGDPSVGDGTLVSMMRGIGLDPSIVTWGRGNIPLGRGPAGDAANVKLQAAPVGATSDPESFSKPEVVMGRGSSFGVQGLPLQTMMGLGRAALPQLGPGRGRTVLGSLASTFPVVAEQPTALPMTSTATAQESPEPPASEPEETAVTTKVVCDSLNKTGTKGCPIQITSNHVPVCCRNEAVYQYHVTFTPNVESMSMRFGMLKEHRPTTGEVVAFDGSILYLPVKLNDVTLSSVRQTDQEEIQIQIKLTKILLPSSDLCLPFYNVVVRRVMKMIGLKLVGRNHYDPESAVILGKHRLQVWPGYATCIKQTDRGLYFCVDVSHKVLRNDSVLDVIHMLFQESKQNFQDECTKELVGSIVLTRYNNRTYRVDDIEWDKSPSDTFSLMDGTKITFVDYYRKNYGITIKELKQPLLVHRPKERSRPGGKQIITGEILIVPELSFMTGIPDKMKKNMKIMKDLTMHVNSSSEQHTLSIAKLLKNITSNPDCVREFGRWGLEISTKLILMKGRTLNLENICMKSSSFAAGTDARWSNRVVRENPISSVPLNSWTVFYAQRCSAEAEELVKTLDNLSGPMGVKMRRPRLVPLKNDYTNTYVRSIHEQITSEPDLQLVLCVVTGNRDDLYGAIKKLCCVQNPIPSQVVNVRTISQPQRLRSVAQMILLQMNAKLGGELWTVSVPLKLLMVVGVDVHHDVSKRNCSVMGFVASVNSVLTRWYSRVVFQGFGEEIIDGFKECFVEALRKFYEVNHSFPDKIVVYRDGVSDGQLSMVEQYEIPQLIKSYKNIGNYQPQMAFISVQKRITTTMYACGSNGYCTPPPGTVLDHTVTKKKWLNFYLLAHSIRHGCGVPTHYVCLYNTTTLTVDQLQRLTFKMCHLYWNFPGTIRVPAPCKYAHKLAYLAGQYLRAQPAMQLTDKLFFL